jgi:ribosomal protein S18 acetylase RimI-like enzyme
MTHHQPNSTLPQDDEAVVIRPARTNDVEGAKRVAARCGKELGFVNLAALRQAQEKDWLLVAAEWNVETNRDEIVGFVNFRLKQDKHCTLYDIAVAKDNRGRGIGTRLLNALKKHVHLESGEGACIQLKCPVELPANEFYKARQFALVGVEDGKKRPLNIWRYELPRHANPEVTDD